MSAVKNEAAAVAALDKACGFGMRMARVAFAKWPVLAAIASFQGVAASQARPLATAGSLEQQPPSDLEKHACNV